MFLAVRPVYHPDMDAPHFTLTDPIALVRDLDVDAILARLDALDQERDALRVLLRAGRARERKNRRSTTEDANHDSQPTR